MHFKRKFDHNIEIVPKYKKMAMHLKIHILHPDYDHGINEYY